MLRRHISRPTSPQMASLPDIYFIWACPGRRQRASVEVSAECTPTSRSSRARHANGDESDKYYPIRAPAVIRALSRLADWGSQERRCLGHVQKVRRAYIDITLAWHWQHFKLVSVLPFPFASWSTVPATFAVRGSPRPCPLPLPPPLPLLQPSSPPPSIDASLAGPIFWLHPPHCIPPPAHPTRPHLRTKLAALQPRSLSQKTVGAGLSARSSVT